MSAKLTLASPTPKEAVNCHDVPSFDNCFFDPYTPGGAIGFKQFDVAVRKDWDTGAGIKFYARADVFNLFNRAQYANPNANISNPAPKSERSDSRSRSRSSSSKSNAPNTGPNRWA